MFLQIPVHNNKVQNIGQTESKGTSVKIRSLSLKYSA